MAPAKELPAWYYRILALTAKGDRDMYPQAFDEDLSELGEEEPDPPSNANCDSDSDDECDCEESDDGEDGLTERSYNGSDADYYYDLKAEREERKERIYDIRKDQAIEKERHRKIESIKEKEGQAALESLRQAEIRGDPPGPFSSIASNIFHLHSLDHFDYRYEYAATHLFSTRYVEFYYLEMRDGMVMSLQPPDNNTKIDGQLYLNNACSCSFDPFYPPKEAGLKKYTLKDIDGRCEPTFQFIDNDHLVMTISRDFVFLDIPMDPRAPEVFTFYGIRHDYKKALEERHRGGGAEKRKRSPSPGDTLFETSHPMGAWNMGGL